MIEAKEVCETQDSMLTRFAYAVRTGDWATAASLSNRLIPAGNPDQATHFDHWTDASLAEECAIHARLSLDPNVTKLMGVVSRRLLRPGSPDAAEEA